MLPEVWTRIAGSAGETSASARASSAAPAASAASAASAFGAGPPPGRGTGLRAGQSVLHAKFGEGVILTLEGRGADARAHINFGRHGSKWLALAVAKLTPVD